MREKKKNHFSKLSRKELQSLCKKYGLPAIGPTPHLASSLFAHFKGKDVNPQLLMDRSGDRTEANPVSEQSRLQPEGPSNFLEATKEVNGTSLQASGAEMRDPNTLIMEKECDKSHSRIGLPLPLSYMEAQPLEMVTEFPVIDGSKEGLACSSSNMRNLHGQSSSPSHPHAIVCRRNDPMCSGSIDGSSALRTTTVDCGHPSDESSMLTEQSPHQVPSFQFFVESERGINLYVDLCSSPSKWIKSLEDEVHICQTGTPNFLHNRQEDCDEPMAHKETGMNNQTPGRNNDDVTTPTTVTSAAIENPSDMILQGESSAEKTLFKERGKDTSSLGCDVLIHKQTASFEECELQILGSSHVKSSVARSKCSDMLERDMNNCLGNSPVKSGSISKMVEEKF